MQDACDDLHKDAETKNIKLIEQCLVMGHDIVGNFWGVAHL